MSNVTALGQFELIKDFITAARNIRAELKLDAKRRVLADCFIQNPVALKVIQANLEPICRLAALSEVRFAKTKLDPTRGVMKSTALFDLLIPHGEGIDRQAEIARLKKKIDSLEKSIEARRGRYDDLEFRNKAPRDVVENLVVKMGEEQTEHKKLKAQLAQLQQLESSQAAGT